MGQGVLTAVAARRACTQHGERRAACAAFSQRRFSGAVVRWLPVNSAAPVPSASPRKGWTAIQKWREKDDPPPSGCSDLVRILRKAERSPKTQLRFWRQAVRRGGHLAMYLGPQETAEILMTFADVRLQWRNDYVVTKGLRRFAQRAAEEIGSYGPSQVGELAMAFARLGMHHDDLLQSLSRRVERIMQVERGLTSNEDLCKILEAYRIFRLMDNTVMTGLSRLICRRLVREPLTSHQTAGVVQAFADLRGRDVALFNATTLALCRKGIVAELTWQQLSNVAVSYASLRLHSRRLFAHVHQRICASSGLPEDTPEGPPPADVRQGERNQQTKKNADALVSASLVRRQLEEPPPQPPIEALPIRAVSNLLEAQVHFGQLSAEALAPLLPHLAHPATVASRPETAAILAFVLSRGGHVWPWLWRWALRACSDERCDAATSFSLLEAMASHLTLIGPALETRGRARRLKRDHDTIGPVVEHSRGLASALGSLLRQIASNYRALSDVQLEYAVSLLSTVIAAQAPVIRVLRDAGVAGASDIDGQLSRAAQRCTRALGADILRRKSMGENQLEQLLGDSGVPLVAICEDEQNRRLDSIVA